MDSAVADRETFSRHPADVGFAAGGSVKSDVADDNVFFGDKSGSFGWMNNNFAARQAFADVIVGIAFEEESHAFGHERAEALPGAAGEINLDGIFGKTLDTPASGDFAADNRADHAVHIANWKRGHHLLLTLDRWSADLEQHGIVQGLFEAMVLRDLAKAANIGRHLGLIKDLGEIETVGFPMIDGLPDFQAVHAPDHAIHLAESELRHQLANFLRDHAHERGDVLRLAGKALAQLRVLGGHAHRTGVEMTNPHHNATHRHEWRGRETEFFSPQQRRNDDIT